jgi:hypothetical protein
MLRCETNLAQRSLKPIIELDFKLLLGVIEALSLGLSC